MKKINWKVRFRNKAFLLTFGAAVVAFIYQVLGLFDIVPSISHDGIVNLLTMLINLLVTLGIVLDPTTQGVSDSDQAMKY